MHLSVIIPAYNEEKRIGKTLESIDTYLSQKNFEYEIIVVNNNSKDGTEALVRGYQERMAALRLMNESGPGKGHAVTRGMVEARGDYRLFTDADNATTIDHIERMMPYFSQGYDIVIGSVAVEGAHIKKGGEEPLWRVILGKLRNKWI